MAIPSPTGAGTSRSSTALDRRFEALYPHHLQALSRYCHALVKDEHDALDVLQNVAVRVTLALRRGAQPKRERGWLSAIVYTEAMSLLRRRRPAPPLDEHLIAPAANPLRTILMRERLAERLDPLGTTAIIRMVALFATRAPTAAAPSHVRSEVSEN